MLAQSLWSDHPLVQTALPNVSGQERRSLLLVFTVPNELYPGPGPETSISHTRSPASNTSPDTLALAKDLGLGPALLELLTQPEAYEDPFAGGIVATEHGMRRGVLTLPGPDPSGVVREASAARAGGTEYFPGAAFSFWTEDDNVSANLPGLYGDPEALLASGPMPLLLWLGGESLGATPPPPRLTVS